jgi:RNA polymerase sigma-70 factor (ECF subfamily)
LTCGPILTSEDEVARLTGPELASLAQKGDVDAFGRLVSHYQGLVFGVGYHYLCDVEDARDMAQDAFVRAFARLAQLREPEKVGSWLRQIAINECRSYASRHWKSISLAEADITVDDRTELDDRILVAQALTKLDEPSRLTVTLFYIHSHSMKDIAAFLDEPVSTIKSRLRNARTKLRKQMEELLDSNSGQTGLSVDFAEEVVRIIEAVKSGDEEAARALLLADPKLVGAREEASTHTALHIAAESGNPALVELLLANGADPNALEKGDNALPIHFAAERGWLEVVKLLVDAGTDLNWDLDVHQRGPLGWAVVLGRKFEVGEYLVAHGAKMDLFSAIALGRPDAIEDLVAQSPFALRQRMSRHEMFRSPIEFAAERKKVEILRLLVDLGCELTLSDAAALGDVNAVAATLSATVVKTSLNMALKAAVRAGQTGTARFILQSQGDPDFTPQGTSLLFDAILGDDEPMAKLLLEFGAELEFKDSQWNSSPLGWAVFFGQANPTRLAIKLGAKSGPNLRGLAEAGERGELRRYSSGSPDGYRAVREILESASPAC